jgi:hypothetical protein
MIRALMSCDAKQPMSQLGGLQIPSFQNSKPQLITPLEENWKKYYSV